MSTTNNSWLANQDRQFIEEVCGDYAQDIIDLIEQYRKEK